MRYLLFIETSKNHMITTQMNSFPKKSFFFSFSLPTATYSNQCLAIEMFPCIIKVIPGREGSRAWLLLHRHRGGTCIIHGTGYGVIGGECRALYGKPWINTDNIRIIDIREPNVFQTQTFYIFLRMYSANKIFWLSKFQLARHGF